MTGHIGIVACSAEGAALCYRTICIEGEAMLGRAHAHPEVSMNTPSLSDYMDRIYEGNWQAVGDLMLKSVAKLKAAGADFVICPDNTIHQALPFIEDRSPLPWLHIARVVDAEAKRRGFKRIGLLGTKWLVDSTVYPADYVRPTTEERIEINRIIMDELVKSVFKPEGIAYHRRVIDWLKAEGCDAVALSCTEIPLIISDGNSSLPTLDSTRLLARAALKRALSGV